MQERTASENIDQQGLAGWLVGRHPAGAGFKGSNVFREVMKRFGWS
ncbi:hypothetical protein KCP70_11045 [Salmonella enterica subsp. enterica]|nr:hypothetical protein KCP70_11045 [Salmonella enterica subsp. enterica]